MIHERILSVDDEPELIEQGFAWLGRDVISSSSHAHILYSEINGTQFLDGYLMTEKMHEEDCKGFVGMTNDFETFCRRHRPADLNDILFLITVYFRNPRSRMKTYEPLRGDWLIDMMLEHSRGYLLWVPQLENIISCFEPDFLRVRKMVKDMRVSKTAQEELKKWKTPFGNTLFDEVSKRKTEGEISYPRIAAAVRITSLSQNQHG